MNHMLNPANSVTVQHLQEFLVGAENAVEFLSGLSGMASAAVSEAAGDAVECAVTLKLRRRPTTAAGSSARALELDLIEQAMGDGPCIRALREMAPVLIDDVARDSRWTTYNQELVKRGVHSTLGVPLEISGEASAALN